MLRCHGAQEQQIPEWLVSQRKDLLGENDVLTALSLDLPSKEGMSYPSRDAHVGDGMLTCCASR